MDPNKPVSPPTESELWLAHDWSATSKTSKPGYTKVSVRETRYADGRIVREVLDENRQPITTRTLDEEIDPDQEKRYKDAQDDAKPPGGLPTRTVNGQVFGWNPTTRAYDIPTGAAVAAPQTPDQARTAAATATENETKAAEAVREAAERKKNRELPPDQDPRDETDAQRAARADARIKEQGAKAEQDKKDADAKAARPGTKIGERTEIKDGVKRTIERWRLPDGKEEDRVAEAPAASSERPGRVEKPYQHDDGKTYTQITETDPATNKSRTYFVDPATGKEVTLPPKGIGNIKDLPSYTPDLTKPGAGLFDYSKQLQEYMAAHPEFTYEKYLTVLGSAQKMADQVASEFNTGAAVLRENFQSQVSQRGQDMTQANSRATLANTHTQNATALIEKFAPYLGVTPGDAGKLFMGMMASQLATATMYGGMQNQPRVEMDPRLMAFADRTVGGASGVPGSAPGISPGISPGIPNTPAPNPDTALAEAVRQARAASGAPLPAPLLGPNTNMTPAGGAPTAGEPGGPPLRPGPVLGAPANAQGAANAGPVPGQDGSVWTPPPANAQAAANAGPVPGQDPNQWTLPPDSAPGAVEQPTPPDFGSPDMRVIPQPPQAMAPGLSNLFANAFPPTWRQQASDNRDYLAGPTGTPPLVMTTQIPGLTPDIDRIAREELAREMQGVV